MIPWTKKKQKKQVNDPITPRIELIDYKSIDFVGSLNLVNRSNGDVKEYLLDARLVLDNDNVFEVSLSTNS